MTPLDEIGNERARQIGIEGWTPQHDDRHRDKSLALAAALYASPIPLQSVEITSDGAVHTKDPWPWRNLDVDPQSRSAATKGWDKRRKHDYRRRLIIAGALIVAEIERLDRISPLPPRP